MRRHVVLFAILFATAGCQPAAEVHRLPTGIVLDPAGPSIPLGSMPVTMTFSPDSSAIVAVLSGFREQGIQVVDVASHRVTQTIEQRSAFLGAAFSTDGRRLYVSGGNRDLVYEYAWSGGRATLADSIALGPPPPDSTGGRRYPAGLACSPDGSRLYVAENLGDAVAVVDLASRRVLQHVPVGFDPYGVVVDAAGSVWVSVWGGSQVVRFAPAPAGLVERARIAVGRHPSSLLLDRAGTRLFVTCATSDRIAVVDTHADSVSAVIDDAAPGGPSEGSTPNALALSPDGSRLYVAEADNDAVALFATDRLSAGAGGSHDALLGRIPVEWYPTAVLARGDSVWVLNGKGAGSGPNPKFRQPGLKKKLDPKQYSLGQTNGSLMTVVAPDARLLAAWSKRVADANGWNAVSAAQSPPALAHVIYVIRENRTYDQYFGDVREADGDTSLVYFGRNVTPNAHALAERFGVFDRFFVNGEVSGDGHNWTDGAYAADYVEKTIPSVYSDRGRSYDYDGGNRGQIPADDVNEPSRGYLWDAARRAGLSLRNYGEFTYPDSLKRWVASKSWLDTRTDHAYPGFDVGISDTTRVAEWLKEFRAQVAGDSMPALTIIYLPNDHTAGARAGAPTPRAYAAASDFAVGQMADALTHSRYWKSTCMFVLEDDAQDGPDHVDSHRSALLVISPYGRAGVRHRFVNTTDVVATVGRILHFDALSKFDHFGRPLFDTFAARPDTAAYVAVRPAIPLDELNSDKKLAALSRHLDFRREDRADWSLFNRVLWLALKGPDRPYPRPAAGPLALRTR